MTTQQSSSDRHSSLSYLALRQGLGILGLSLPILVWVFNDFDLKPSISHFYYSSSSVIFTGFMFTFGICLIFYPGRDDKDVRVSDNLMTTIGGIGAILTALIPTAFCSDCGDCSIIITDELSHFCKGQGLTTQYLHNNGFVGAIHLICAAVFLVLMGYMSWARFTKGKTSYKMKWFYRFCAIMVWVSLLILGIEFATGMHWTEYDVFIFECVALGFFGIAWLVKGKTFQRFGFN
jgi:hypothetical protein